MAQLFEDRERNIVPRWRSFAATSAFGELKPLVVRNPGAFNESMLADLLDDWRREPGVSVASELVSAAFTLGLREPARDAARFILSRGEATPTARNFAEHCLSDKEPPPNPDLAEFYKQPSFSQICTGIRSVKARLAEYPINPVLWTNLALFYTTLGQREKGAHAMRAALGLAPNNRFVVRAACRMYLHHGELELAHNVLLRAPSIKNDPWVLAAEIAVAQVRERTSRLVKSAQRMAESQNYSPFNVSELTGALATLEASDGNVKRARKLTGQSMIDPAENAIAQVAWLNRSERLGGPFIPTALDTCNEASAYSLGLAGNWKAALSHAMEWQIEQPFSGRPATLGSYVASTALEDFELAAQIARFGTRCNPEDSTLHNNLAFALASLGDIEEASKVAQYAFTLPGTKQQRICLIATRGLIEFRSGRASNGRLLYESAMQAANAMGDKKLAAVAQIYLSMEQIRANPLERSNWESRAKHAVDELPDLLRPVFADKLKITIDDVGPKNRILPVVSDKPDFRLL
jgi:Flp pilus assembly protein TadD